MPTAAVAQDFLSSHTFGRHHVMHLALPTTVQQGQTISVGQMGATVSGMSQMHAGPLEAPDLDQLVRSVGEW